MKILYVDDDAEDQEIFADAINSIDPLPELITCSSGREMMDHLKHHSFQYIFLDYRLPIMDGKEILKLLENTRKVEWPKIFIISTFMNEFEIEECRKLGAHDCIKKPGSFDALCTLLKSIIRP
jgi:CheY-like chemotaxis protein